MFFAFLLFSIAFLPLYGLLFPNTHNNLVSTPGFLVLAINLTQDSSHLFFSFPSLAKNPIFLVTYLNLVISWNTLDKLILFKMLLSDNGYLLSQYSTATFK